jgi:hypothetical protein
MLQAMRDVKMLQVSEAIRTLDSLNKSNAVIQLHHDYYANLPIFIDHEISQLSAFGHAGTKDEVRPLLPA